MRESSAAQGAVVELTPRFKQDTVGPCSAAQLEDADTRRGGCELHAQGRQAEGACGCADWQDSVCGGVQASWYVLGVWDRTTSIGDGTVHRDQACDTRAPCCSKG